VVAYANGGLAEYVGDAGGGEVVRQDCRELGRAARELSGDRERWERESRAGHDAVLRTHNRERYVAGIESLVERALTAS
jgi:hypothetical protein